MHCAIYWRADEQEFVIKALTERGITTIIDDEGKERERGRKLEDFLRAKSIQI